MFDAFLNDLLKIVVVVDILAVIAYFMLSTRRRQADATTASANSSSRGILDIQLIAKQGNTGITCDNNPPLHERVTAAIRRRFQHTPHRRSTGATESLDEAFRNLRRVLTSYGQGLA